MSEERQSYDSTFTSFSGADLLFYVGNSTHPIGEIQEVHHTENFSPLAQYDLKPGERYFPITGYVDVCVFAKESGIRKAIKEDAFSPLEVLCANEYGQKMSVLFKNTHWLRKETTDSVDTLMRTERYFFGADDLVYNYNPLMPGERIELEQQAEIELILPGPEQEGE